MTSSDASAAANAAADVADRLPADQVEELGRAALEGPRALDALRRRAASPVLREAVAAITRADAPGPDLLVLGGALLGAAEARRRTRAASRMDVVWTGPQSSVRTSRLTEAVVAELIDTARLEILLVSYATLPDAAVRAALGSAVDRGVEVIALLERPSDNNAFRGAEEPLPGLRCTRLTWPAHARPRGASMHAKVLVIDISVALVGSANLTGRAMADNLECGVLIRGGPEPAAIRAHLMQLRAARVLTRA